jgi:hypothetical protein
MSKVICNLCGKLYSSNNSLCNHKRLYHKIIKRNKNTNNELIINNTNTRVSKGYPKGIQIYPKRYPMGIQNNNDNINDSNNNDNSVNNKNIIKYKCNYCDKEYKYKSGKYKHQKKCKNNNGDLHNKLKVMESDLKKYKAELSKVNNININTNNTDNSNSHNTINNTINNTVNVLALGKEDLPNKIPDEMQIKILNKGSDCLTYLINYIHFNPEYPEYQSIRLNNMRGMIGYLFNEKTKRFEAIPKRDLIELVKYERICDIENFYEYNSDNIANNTGKQISNLIDKVNSNSIKSKNENIKVECALYNGTRKLDTVLDCITIKES